MPMETKVDLNAATDRARAIRELYQKLEKRLHGTAWTPQEMMLGYMADVGELGRLVMAQEGRWLHAGNLPKELDDKLADCLWWVLVLAERMGTDLTAAFTAKMNELDANLSQSVAQSQKTD